MNFEKLHAHPLTKLFMSKAVTRLLYLFLGLMLISAVGLISIYLMRDHYRVGVNLTPSLPHKLFVVKVGEMPHKGDLVSFRWVNTEDIPLHNPYPHQSIFVKIVGGTAGDRVDVVGRDVFVNGVLLGAAKEKSLRGLPLEIRQPGVIPADEFYVYTPHKDSFDSRYAMVGNITRAQVVGKAYPLF